MRTSALLVLFNSSANQSIARFVINRVTPQKPAIEPCALEEKVVIGRLKRQRSE